MLSRRGVSALLFRDDCRRQAYRRAARPPGGGHALTGYAADSQLCENPILGSPSIATARSEPSVTLMRWMGFGSE